MTFNTTLFRVMSWSCQCDFHQTTPMGWGSSLTIIIIIPIIDRYAAISSNCFWEAGDILYGHLARSLAMKWSIIYSWQPMSVGCVTTNKPIRLWLWRHDHAHRKEANSAMVFVHKQNPNYYLLTLSRLNFQNEYKNDVRSSKTIILWLKCFYLI